MTPAIGRRDLDPAHHGELARVFLGTDYEGAAIRSALIDPGIRTGEKAHFEPAQYRSPARRIPPPGHHGRGPRRIRSRERNA